jgi:hypothetical protein
MTWRSSVFGFQADATGLRQHLAHRRVRVGELAHRYSGHNTTPIYYKKELHHSYDKKFDDGSSRQFTPDVALARGTASQLFKLDGLRCGIEVCGDINEEISRTRRRKRASTWRSTRRPPTPTISRCTSTPCLCATAAISCTATRASATRLPCGATVCRQFSAEGGGGRKNGPSHS